jgi:prepilin-type N-terminal cleavage/methylation domain-containing protein
MTLMVKSESGFSLIEISIALAISSMLIVLVLAGQSNLRSQATFSASIDKVIANIADARNQAVSGVVSGSDGTGSVPAGCGALAAPVYQAGTVWTPSVAPLTFAPAKLETWVSDGTNVCQDASKTLAIGTASMLTLTPVGIPGTFVAYVRSVGGGFRVCTTTTAALVPSLFQNPSGCASAAVTMKALDSDGHTANLLIDPVTGLAKRF